MSLKRAWGLLPLALLFIAWEVAVELKIYPQVLLPAPAKVAAVFLFGQTMEGNVLSPNLVGDRTGLHPVWIMFALLAGGALFGFVGVLNAVPVAAVIGVIVRFLIRRYRASPLYRGRSGG